MRYMMTDWRGRQVGNLEESVDPLVEMARELNETNDMVIWSIDLTLTHRVIGIIGRDPRIVTTFYKV